MNAGYQPPTNIQHFVRSPPKDNITFRYPNKGECVWVGVVRACVWMGVVRACVWVW